MRSFLVYCGLLAVLGTLVTETLGFTSDQGTIAELAPIFLPYVKTLSRDIEVFHYATREKMGPGIPRVGRLDPHLDLQDFLRAKLAQYEDLTHPNLNDDNTMGPGLYVASDPLSSRGYGQENWVMVEMTFPKGLHYLETRHDPQLPAEALPLLKREGCQALNWYALFAGNFNNSCRALLIPLLQALKVAAVAYGWDTNHFELCPAREFSSKLTPNEPRPYSANDAAFLVTGSELLLAHTRIFSAESVADFSTREEMSLIQSYEKRALRYLMNNQTTLKSFPAYIPTAIRYVKLWPELYSEPEAKGLKTWVHEHLFGCGAHPEDLP